MRSEIILCLSFVVALSLIKENTCFKSVQNSSCIDLILTNRPNSFQNSMVIETGLSDFHKLTTTVNYKKCLHAKFLSEIHYLVNWMTYFILQMMTL